MIEATGEKLIPNSGPVTAEELRPIQRRITESSDKKTKPVKDSEDSIKLYLDQIGKYPLLTKDEEFELAEKMELGNIASERLESQQDIDATSEADLYRQVRMGSRAKEQFINSNLRLVVFVAKKWQGNGVPLQDLIQDGSIGLIRAVEKFDRHLGFKFSTYATWWIGQSVGRGVANRASNVRLPVNVREEKERSVKLYGIMSDKLGRAPTAAEMAEALGVTKEKYDDLQRISLTEASLNTKIGDEGSDTEFGDILPDNNTSTEEEAIGNLVEHDLAKMMKESGLTERERDILVLRFGLDGGEARTLGEIGDVYDLTRERIRQIIRNSLNRLKEAEEQTSKVKSSLKGEVTEPKINNTRVSQSEERDSSDIFDVTVPNLLKKHTVKQVYEMTGIETEAIVSELSKRGYNLVVDVDEFDQ